MDLKQARVNARYSYKQVCAELGISYPTYKRIEENPGDNLSVNQALILAELFGVGVDEIFFPSNSSEAGIEQQ